MWQDSRALGGVPITWELFKTAFLEIFFLREMREDKFKELINLKRGSMIVSEYSLKFVKLSRYATSLMSYIRDQMSRFLKGIVEDLNEECREAMLHENKDHSQLMVHVQHVKESRKKKLTRGGNRSRQDFFKEE